MAKTFEELKQLAIQIRDEKTNKQNTATRIGTQMLEHLSKLEQEYYDKEYNDIITQNHEKKLSELEIKVDSQKEEVDKAKEDAIKAIDENEQSAISNFNSQRVTPDMLSESTKQLIEASGGGTITNLPDDEDLESLDDGTGSKVLKLKNRAYNPVNFSGKGYCILRKNVSGGKNILTQDMINEPNTVYEIRYDFDLNGGEISVPDNCVLDFKGGTLSNGEVRGKGTSIQTALTKIFSLDISLKGTFNNEEIYPEWFGATGVLDESVDDSVYINKALSLIPDIYPITKVKLSGQYHTKDTIYLTYACTLEGDHRRFFKNEAQIYSTFDAPNKWIIDTTNIIKSTGKQNPYNGILTGHKYDNGDFSRCDNVVVRNLSVNAKNEIYGGIRISSPGLEMNSVSVLNTIHGIQVMCSWNVIIERVHTHGVLYGLEIGWDANDCVIRNCYFSGSDKIANDTTRSVFFTSTELLASDFNHDSSIGVIGTYCYGITFINTIIERFTEAYILIQVQSLFNTGSYLERIYKCLYRTITTDGYIGKHIGLLEDNVKYFDFCTLSRLTLVDYNLHNKIIKIENWAYINLINCNLDIDTYISKSKYISLNYELRDILVDSSIEGSGFIERRNGDRPYFIYVNTLEKALDVANILTSNDVNIYIKNNVEIDSKNYISNKNISIIGLNESDKYTLIFNAYKQAGGYEGLYFIHCNHASVRFSNLEIIVGRDDVSNNRDDEAALRIAQNNNIFIDNCNITLKNRAPLFVLSEIYYGSVNNTISFSGTDVSGERIGAGNDFGSVSLLKQGGTFTAGLLGSFLSNCKGYNSIATRSGAFNQKPTVEESGITEGFAYFCTDKQTSEGSANGIMIYHKGNNVWVDALGRTVS